MRKQEQIEQARLEGVLQGKKDVVAVLIKDQVITLRQIKDTELLIEHLKWKMSYITNLLKIHENLKDTHDTTPEAKEEGAASGGPQGKKSAQDSEAEREEGSQGRPQEQNGNLG